MDDMNAFDKQLASVVLRRVGPSEPVDDAAIFTAITATRSPKWRFGSMFSATKFVVAGAVVALFGGFLLVAQPFDRLGDISPGAGSDAEGVAASPRPTLRESVPWGSKRIYFTPPPGFPTGTGGVEWGIHDVARVALPACADSDSFVEVGPTAKDLTEALADLTGQGHSGPVDVTVSGYPATRFVIYRDLGPVPPGCRTYGEGGVTTWENHDGTSLGTMDGGFAIIVVADVEGERLAFAAFTPGHGLYGPPPDPFVPEAQDPEAQLAALEAHADALVASMEIVDPDPLRAAWVTGTVSGGTQVGSPEVTIEEGVTRSYPFHWRDMRMVMSDERLSGTLHTIYNQDVHGGASGDLSQFLVGAGAYRIENEGGSWEGPSIFLNEGSSGTATVSDTGLLVGDGAYEGLSAFLVFDMSQRPGAVVGAIFPGEVPPVATFE
jgi:hypothetical protein